MTFAIYYTEDAYSFGRAIMGRQSTGIALLDGIARSWDSVSATGASANDSLTMLAQLRSGGFGGDLLWSTSPDLTSARNAGTLYYPSPPTKMFAAARDACGANSFSLMGVTHSLSSITVAEQIADLLLPPFKPWDALICTSGAAHELVTSIHDEMRDYWRETTGASRFSGIQVETIPLGINVPAFAKSDDDRTHARLALGIQSDETVFLMAGRLSFHAKANPVAAYQALETLGQERAIVCIEAGIYPNRPVADAFEAARKSLAPSVRFIHVDGANQPAYRNGWHAADIFVSLSDNIQETFGLTPLEAMASGLPVIVSDWDGYKDSVRHGIEGFRIPTYFPQNVPDNAMQRYALGRDDYDTFIGRTSLATVVDSDALLDAMRSLVLDPGLRRRMADAARRRAADFDWPLILARYCELAAELAARRANGAAEQSPYPPVLNPFQRFAGFPTAAIDDGWHLNADHHSASTLERLSALSVANYGFDPGLLPRDAPSRLLEVVLARDIGSVGAAMQESGMSEAVTQRALMWLWKFGVIKLKP